MISGHSNDCSDQNATRTPPEADVVSWVGSRLGSDGGADGCFAPVAENSYCPTTDRISLCKPGRWASCLSQVRAGDAGGGTGETIVGKPGLPIVRKDAAIGIGHM